MTQKEKNDELTDKFKHKKALDEKINYNIGLGIRYEEAAEKETDPEKKKALRKMVTRGRKVVSDQVTEGKKFSFTRIGQDMGISRHAVMYRYNKFTEFLL